MLMQLVSRLYCTLFYSKLIIEQTELRPPNPNQAVYREDCTQCFDSIVGVLLPLKSSS